MSECNKELVPIFNEMQELAYKHQLMEEGSEIWKETDRRLQTLYNHASSIFNRYHKERVDGGFFMKMYNERKEKSDDKDS